MCNNTAFKSPAPFWAQRMHQIWLWHSPVRMRKGEEEGEEKKKKEQEQWRWWEPGNVPGDYSDHSENICTHCSSVVMSCQHELHSLKVLQKLLLIVTLSVNICGKQHNLFCHATMNWQIFGLFSGSSGSIAVTMCTHSCILLIKCFVPFLVQSICTLLQIYCLKPKCMFIWQKHKHRNSPGSRTLWWIVSPELWTTDPRKSVMRGQT